MSFEGHLERVAVVRISRHQIWELFPKMKINVKNVQVTDVYLEVRLQDTKSKQKNHKNKIETMKYISWQL
jgi:hypothetical protein